MTVRKQKWTKEEDEILPSHPESSMKDLCALLSDRTMAAIENHCQIHSIPCKKILIPLLSFKTNQPAWIIKKA